MIEHFAARRFWILALALIAVLGIVQVVTMLGETQTWDEGIHLTAGYSYLTTGDYSMNSEHPVLAKILCTLPLLALHPALDPAWLKMTQQEAGLWFLYRNRVSPDTMLAAGRAVTVAMTLLFAAWIAVWTRRRFGPVVALTALGLFCFDPNIIAHGRYVTTDLAAAFFIFLASTLWIDYLLEPTTARLVCAGLALGAAISSKYSALFLVPLVILAGLWRRRWGATAAVVAIAIAVVAVLYAPEIIHHKQIGLLRPKLSLQTGLSKVMFFFAKRLGLPALSYFMGLERLADHNRIGHPSYVLGHVWNYGVWYYFPVAFLVKTPLATLAAIATGLALAWKQRARGFLLVALLVVPGVFAAFCLTSQIDIGHRHILPVYAFLFVIAALALSRWPKLAALAVLLVGIESFSVYPHYLAFFNRAVGGPANGPQYLVDSNIDWGQDLKKLGRYMSDHQIPRVCFCYFGNSDWGRYGIRSIDFPPRHEDCREFAAISATPLYGLYTVTPDEYKFLRDKTPLAKIGYSIYLYDLR